MNKPMDTHTNDDRLECMTPNCTNKRAGGSTHCVAHDGHAEMYELETLEAEVERLKAEVERLQTKNKCVKENYRDTLLEAEDLVAKIERYQASNDALQERLDERLDDWNDFRRYTELKEGAKNRDWIYKKAAQIEAALAKATVHIRDQDSLIATIMLEVKALKGALYQVAKGAMKVRVAVNEDGEEIIQAADVVQEPDTAPSPEKPTPSPLVLPRRYEG